jgi:hypothetical protein
MNANQTARPTVQEHLKLAAEAIGTGPGEIQERVAQAARHLLRIRGGEEQMPDRLREPFESILRDLAGDSTTAAGSIDLARIRHMGFYDAAKLAGHILRLEKQSQTPDACSSVQSRDRRERALKFCRGITGRSSPS